MTKGIRYRRPANYRRAPHDTVTDEMNKEAKEKQDKIVNTYRDRVFSHEFCSKNASNNKRNIVKRYLDIYQDDIHLMLGINILGITSLIDEISEDPIAGFHPDNQPFDNTKMRQYCYWHLKTYIEDKYQNENENGKKMELLR